MILVAIIKLLGINVNVLTFEHDLSVVRLILNGLLKYLSFLGWISEDNYSKHPFDVRRRIGSEPTFQQVLILEGIDEPVEGGYGCEVSSHALGDCMRLIPFHFYKFGVRLHDLSEVIGSDHGAIIG